VRTDCPASSCAVRRQAPDIVKRWLRQIPNIITALRILLVIPIALSLLHGRLIATMALFGAAIVSDGADGFLAKRFGWQSDVGSVLDPAADKLLLATVFVVLAVLHLVPAWLMAAAVARDLIIVSGAIVYRVFFGPIEIRASALSKLNTLCQALYILAVVARAQFVLPARWVVIMLGAVTFLTITVSGIDYVLRYGKAALQAARSSRIAVRPGGSKAI
jgi:cardiolipin synthase (CMP-forming)